MTPEHRPLPDELLDELDASMNRMGRLMAAKHGGDKDHIGAPQYIVLHALAERGPLRVSDLASAMCVKPPSASALIDSLERESLVVREPDPDDRRATRIRLTPQGEAELRVAEARRRELLRRYTSFLTEDDVRDLIRINAKLIQAVSAEVVS